jgi:hypothetical protein
LLKGAIRSNFIAVRALVRLRMSIKKNTSPKAMPIFRVKSLRRKRNSCLRWPASGTKPPHNGPKLSMQELMEDLRYDWMRSEGALAEHVGTLAEWNARRKGRQ